MLSFGSSLVSIRICCCRWTRLSVGFLVAEQKLDWPWVLLPVEVDESSHQYVVVGGEGGWGVRVGLG